MNGCGPAECEERAAAFRLRLDYEKMRSRAERAEARVEELTALLMEFELAGMPPDRLTEMG